MRRIVSCAAALIAALVLTAACVSSATAGRPRQPESKPTVVLVHGAWADGSSWSGVTRRLQRAGYPVVVTANPLRGVAGDAAYLANVLKTISGPVVLAGHSYGGMVISNAAVGSPNVRALVFVNAYIPDQGETVIGLTGARPGSRLGGDPTTVFDFVPYPGAPMGDVDLYVKRNVFLAAFANDLPKAQGMVLAASQRPLTLSAASEPSGPPAWKRLPSWAVIGTADRVIPPAQQRFMAQRARSKVTEIRAGHLSMVSRPAAVERVIARAAASR